MHCENAVDTREASAIVTCDLKIRTITGGIHLSMMRSAKHGLLIATITFAALAVSQSSVAAATSSRPTVRSSHGAAQSMTRVVRPVHHRAHTTTGRSRRTLPRACRLRLRRARFLRPHHATRRAPPCRR
jgi:hypothetical protein